MPRGVLGTRLTEQIHKRISDRRCASAAVSQAHPGPMIGNVRTTSLPQAIRKPLNFLPDLEKTLSGSGQARVQGKLRVPPKPCGDLAVLTATLRWFTDRSMEALG
jgi:hypothetical protein